MASETLKNVAEEECKDVADVDLDFHIQFPIPGYENGDCTDTTGFKSRRSEDIKGEVIEKIWPIPGYQDKDNLKKDAGDEKEILVILLGWAGSKHKNLAKYSDIYLQRGYVKLMNSRIYEHYKYL